MRRDRDRHGHGGRVRLLRPPPIRVEPDHPHSIAAPRLHREQMPVRDLLVVAFSALAPTSAAAMLA